MKTSTWIKLVLGSSIVVFIGVGAYVIFTRLDERMITYCIGGLFVLMIFIVVGGLLIGKDLVQTYIVRRVVAQDDMSDMKQMAFIMRMMGGLRTPNVNVRMPKESTPPQFLLPGVWGENRSTPPPPDTFNGNYKDTTIDLE